MIFFKKATGKLAAKRDLDVVLNFIKAEYKSKLDCDRYAQETGMLMNFDTDEMLNDAHRLLGLTVVNINDINKRTAKIKDALQRAKQSDITPDEDHSINMTAIKDIKKAGLSRPLTDTERSLLKKAKEQFSVLYALRTKEHKLNDGRH